MHYDIIVIPKKKSNKGVYMEFVKIDTEYIKLGQFLKLIGVADSGAHAKILLEDGLVKVNNTVEIRRGKKVYNGDIIEIENKTYTIDFVHNRPL